MMSDSLTYLDRRIAAGAGLLIALVMGLAALLLDSYAREGDFLLYRLAQNLHAGHGLVYNADERALLVMHPLPVLPLALDPTAAPRIAALMTALEYALAGWAAYRLLRRAGLVPSEAGAALGLWLVAWPVWTGVRAPAALAVMVILLAMEALEQRRWRLAGLVAGLAVLIQPEGVIGCLALGVYASLSERPWRYWQTVWMPAGLWVAGSLLFLTSGGLPEVIVVGVDAAARLAWQEGTWVVLLILALPVLTRCKADARVWLLVLWASAEIGAQLVISGKLAPVRSATLPLAVACAAVIGSRPLAGLPRARVLAAILGGMACLLVLVPPRTPPRLAEDIALGRHLTLPVGASIAHDRGDAFTYYVGSGGTKIYPLRERYSPLVDALLARGDLESLMVALAPDYLYVNTLKQPFSELDFDGQEMRDLAYAAQPGLEQVPGAREGDQLWVRGSSVGVFGSTQAVSLDFGQDARLIGYALDRARLRPGEIVRVRLDWSLDRPPEGDVDVHLTVLNGESTPVSAIYTRFPPADWTSLTPSTYQVIRLPGDGPPGLLDLFITVGYEAGTLGQYRLASLLVPLPQPPPGAVLASDGPLGFLGDAVLEGAGATAQADGLRIDLTWSTGRVLPRDYVVFVHLTPADDVNPVVAADGPPYNGRYPSSWWLPGELIPDEHLIQLDGIPPGEYVVRVGLYVPGGNRLTGSQGDSLAAARVRIDAGGGVTILLPG